ncbi:Activator heat shock protein ATPase 1 [Liparis tanakae]|uniref:Activator heat shock protein ATPase 1 n=1 Tax=Liparis tanakae TaxID=230148 RepID=A0A4Z2EFM5_9TELE|nr:Activator heat shock protein ATPase 1 [Liparis tanakae]
MAKWGEGDPRWIVEERADATNVNNWHWTERDATTWSSDKLKWLLVGLSVEGGEGRCEVTEVSKISVSLNKDEPETPLTDLMKKLGVEKIREVLGSYVGFLKTGEWTRTRFWFKFTQGMILPTANGLTGSSQSRATLDKTRVRTRDLDQISSSSSTSSSAPVNTGVKIPTCKFSMREKFLTSPADLYRVFLNQEMTQAFTHAPATVDGEKGGKFRLLEGNVFGEFTELVPDKKIVMKWRYNNWPCGTSLIHKEMLNISIYIYIYINT